MPLKVLHVVPTFYPATYWGGPIHSLYGLCNALARSGDVKVRVLTSNSAGPNLSEKLNVGTSWHLMCAGYEVCYCQRLAGHSIAPAMLYRLPAMVRWADVVHLTGVYSFPTFPTLALCVMQGKPVVWSPRGALQRWEGSRKILLKHLWNIACNYLADKEKTVLHVTSIEEAEQSRCQITTLRIEVIPNGVEIPSVIPLRTWMPDGHLRLLYIGRLDPKKGIENLLHAIKLLNGQETLSICGGGDVGYVALLKQLAHDLGLDQRVSFRGHIEGEKKSDAFWNADVCIVPSFTENFGMVVAEALAHAVPVIASRGTPWRDVLGWDCGLWVDNDGTALAEAIAAMRNRDLQAMGQRGRKWMEVKFTWPSVATAMHGLYQQLVSGQRA